VAFQIVDVLRTHYSRKMKIVSILTDSSDALFGERWLVKIAIGLFAGVHGEGTRRYAPPTDISEFDLGLTGLSAIGGTSSIKGLTTTGAVRESPKRREMGGRATDLG
jgi:hypothetical protein